MNKIAVITGASRGLGLETAREFATNGWQVIGTGRSGRPSELPSEIAYHQFDASVAKDCDTFWKEINADAVWCLVNNAGGYVSGGLLETSAEGFATQMNSIYFSAVYMTRGLAKVASAAKIINVISSSALTAHKNNSAYGAAKAAEMHFFQSLQQEFKSGQYQITNLYPSDIATSGPNPAAIKPTELAVFIRQQAELGGSYYLRDVTIYPS